MYALSSPYANYLARCRSGFMLYVKLGSPRLRDCRGVGICEISIDDQAGADCKCCINAFARIDGPTGRLLLHLDPNSLSTAVRKQHFGGGSFTVETAYPLPEVVSTSLKLPQGTRIGRGTYPCLEDEHFLTLSLRVAATDVHTLPHPALKRAA